MCSIFGTSYSISLNQIEDSMLVFVCSAVKWSLETEPFPLNRTAHISLSAETWTPLITWMCGYVEYLLSVLVVLVVLVVLSHCSNSVAALNRAALCVVLKLHGNWFTAYSR